MKSRLRHPIRAIREPFGTAGLIVAMVALVAALGGTALAAAKLNSTQKKEVEKIAKKFAGKPGAPGATGPAGPAGAKGDAGAAGGAGPAGESVTVKALAKGEEGCTEGGAKFSNASGTSKACNGLKGSQGPEGNIKKTLPSGFTEQGTWATLLSGNVEGLSGTQLGIFSISYNIPLEAALPEANIEFKKHGFEGQAGEECPGKASEPQAKAGFLCVYVIEEPEGAFGGASVASTAGGSLFAFNGKNSERDTFISGTWAVTAE